MEKRNHPYSHDQLEMRYLSLLPKRLLSFAISDEKIDFINYFKGRKIYEEYQLEDDQPLRNMEEFNVYIANAKNKKATNSRNVLETACLGCCSEYYEQYNQFEHC